MSRNDLEALAEAVCAIIEQHHPEFRDYIPCARDIAARLQPARVPAFRDRVSEIEDAVSAGTMNAFQCFTQMRQLVVSAAAPAPEFPKCEPLGHEIDTLMANNIEAFLDDHPAPTPGDSLSLHGAVGRSVSRPGDSLRGGEGTAVDRENIRSMNYQLWMDGAGGIEPPKEWADGYRHALSRIAAHPAPEAQAVCLVGERGSVSWRSETILPFGTPLYTHPAPAAGQREGVEALTALVQEWRTRIPSDAPTSERVGMREYCADQLEAVIRRLAGQREGVDWRYAVVSAIEYIDAGDIEQARSMLESARRLAAQPASITGVYFIIDESVPPGEVRVVQDDKMVAKVVGIEQPASAGEGVGDA